jgi:hypothetical protein
LKARRPLRDPTKSCVTQWKTLRDPVEIPA